MYREKSFYGTKALVLLGLACCLLVSCGCGIQVPSAAVEEDMGDSQSQEEEGWEMAGASQEEQDLEEALGEEAVESDSSQGEAGIYVQVSGAVVSPGVYQVPEGSRVFVAVELAGGLTEDAQESSLNQAEVLSDGQMVYVSTREEEVQAQEAEASDGLVNINQATAQELMTLPGIGQAKADSIISWRESHGEFANIEDIMEIDGIKEGVFSKIKDHIKVK